MLLTRSLIERIDCRASRGVEEGGIRGGGRYTLRAAKNTLKCLWKPIPPTHSRPLRVASPRDNTLCAPKCQVKTAWYFSRPCLWGLGGPGRARVYGNPPGIFELRVYGNVRLSSVFRRRRRAGVSRTPSRPLPCGISLTELPTSWSVACGILLAGLSTWAAVCHV